MLRAIQVDLTLLTSSLSYSNEQQKSQMQRKDIQYYISLFHIETLRIVLDMKECVKTSILDAANAS